MLCTGSYYTYVFIYLNNHSGSVESRTEGKVLADVIGALAPHIFMTRKLSTVERILHG